MASTVMLMTLLTLVAGRVTTKVPATRATLPLLSAPVAAAMLAVSAAMFTVLLVAWVVMAPPVSKP